MPLRAQPMLIKVSLRCQTSGEQTQWQSLEMLATIAPNTAGCCHSAQEAITTAQGRVRCLATD
jgi:thiazole synthase ThiGH ThiG subunit